MRSRTFDFLADSFLFRDDLIDEQFSQTPLSEIERELEAYREFCIRCQGDILADVDAGNSNLSIYSAERANIRDLTQAALYVQQYVLQDPLFRLTAKRSESAKALTRASTSPMAAASDGALQLDDLSRTLRFLKTVTPMVAGNFLKFVPSSLGSEEPTGIPLYSSDNYFEDALPAEILRLFKEAAQVSSVIVNTDGSLRLEKLRPSRRISITFKGDLDEHAFMYALHQIEDAEEKADFKNQLTIKLSLPSTPPEKPHFRVWMQQSVNQAARNLFRETYDAASVAANLNLAYSTKSALRFNALRKAVKPGSSVPVHTANTFLNLDLPFIENIDIERLMQIRREQGEAFSNFRLALDDKLASLRGISDPSSAKRAASDAVRELTEAQLHDVDFKMRSLREKLGLCAIGGLVGMAAAVQNHGFGLLSAVAAAMPAASAVLDYRKDVKRHPAFFLWKILAKKQRC